MVYSGASGSFRFQDVTCGQYKVDSQNGSHPTEPLLVTVPATMDVLTITLPVTGVLDFPYYRIFTPFVAGAE